MNSRFMADVGVWLGVVHLASAYTTLSWPKFGGGE